MENPTVPKTRSGMKVSEMFSRASQEIQQIHGSMGYRSPTASGKPTACALGALAFYEFPELIDLNNTSAEQDAWLNEILDSIFDDATIAELVGRPETVGGRTQSSVVMHLNDDYDVNFEQFAEAARKKGQ